MDIPPSSIKTRDYFLSWTWYSEATNLYFLLIEMLARHMRECNNAA